MNSFNAFLCLLVIGVCCVSAGDTVLYVEQVTNQHNGSGNGGTPLLQQQWSSSPLANIAISQQSLTLQSPPTPNGPSSLTPNGPSISSLTQNGGKRRRPLPKDVKDEAYWERRRKNN